MRLIDADKLRKGVIELPDLYNGFSDTYDKAYILDLVDEQPTIDAEPTKHGHWVNNRNMYIEWATCSQCGAEWNKYENEFFRFNFCPNCGVKMDGDDT